MEAAKSKIMMDYMVKMAPDDACDYSVVRFSCNVQMIDKSVFQPETIKGLIKCWDGSLIQLKAHRGDLLPNEFRLSIDGDDLVRNIAGSVSSHGEYSDIIYKIQIPSILMSLYKFGTFKTRANIANASGHFSC